MVNRAGERLPRKSWSPGDGEGTDHLLSMWGAYCQWLSVGHPFCGADCRGVWAAQCHIICPSRGLGSRIRRGELV